MLLLSDSLIELINKISLEWLILNILIYVELQSVSDPIQQN